MRLGVGRGRATKKFLPFPSPACMRRAVFVGAGEHAERFGVGMTLPNELGENRARSFGSATAGKRQTLELAQAHIARKFDEALPDDVVGEERLALLQDLFAEQAKKFDWPLLAGRYPRAPDRDQVTGRERFFSEPRDRLSERLGSDFRAPSRAGY